MAALCNADIVGMLGEDPKPKRKRDLHGIANPRAILTERQVLTIRKALAAGASQGDLAYAYGTAKSTISAICTGRSWKHLL